MPSLEPSSRTAGFTLLEVLLATILLTAGIGALLGTAVLTTRMVAGGRQTSRVIEAAGAQFERLRAASRVPPLYCAGLTDGADSASDGTRWEWQVRPLGQLREVTVIATVPVPGGQALDSITGVLRCL